MRRIAPILVPLLIAMQLLLAIPAVGLAQAAAGHGMSGQESGCPCCPAGDVSSMTDCLVGCTLASAIMPSASPMRILATSHPEFVDPDSSFDTRFDPPLNPPPIA
ncbi:MAG TPA: hypothetical protein VFP37_05205 [Steroidobacteraceae bacterium]|nr:hypothetical protein [Steroidobacteraceae bacterium]